LSYELGTVSYIIIMEQWNYWFSRRMTLIKLCIVEHWYWQ